MPVPIMPVNVDSLIRDERARDVPPVEYFQVDVSGLPLAIEKSGRSQDMLKVSNFEAGLLFRLWNDSGAGPNDEGVDIPSTVTNNDILRLKASGLIVGDTAKFTLTQRGKDVLTTIVLGEKNMLDKSSKSKSFEQLASEQRKRVTGGPRLAVGKK